MIYVRADVILATHPRAMRAEDESPGSMSLYFWALLHVRSHDGDGSVSKLALRRWWGDPSHADQHAKALVASGLFDDVGESITICKYAEKNETKQQIDNRRALTRQRVTRYRSVSNANVADDVTRECNATVPDSGSGSVFLPEGGLGETDQPASEAEPTKAQKLAAWEAKHRDAYVRGIADGKRGPFVWSGGLYDQGALNEAIRAFGRLDDTGDVRSAERLLRWTHAAAKDFAEDMVRRPTEAKYYFSFSPKGFKKWLNEEETNKIKETA